MKRRGWYRIVAVALLATSTALGAWGLTTYLSLVRQQQDLARACNWLEAACRLRVERVDGLLEDARSFEAIEPEHLDRVRDARGRLEEFGSVLSMVERPERFLEFDRAQRELSQALTRFWSTTPEFRGPSARLLVSELEPPPRHSAATIAQGFDAVVRQARAFEQDLSRFPRGLVAAVASLEVPGLVGGPDGPGPAAQR